MLPYCFRSTLPGAFVLVATLAGCSAARDSERATASPEEPVHQFSEEDRLAARALSIGNRYTVQDAGSPYDQALTCRSAIKALAERLRQSDTLSGEQLHLVEQAAAVYDQRIRILASQGGRSDSSSDQDLQGKPEDTPAGEEALQAIGCIQKLATAG